MLDVFTEEWFVYDYSAKSFTAFTGTPPLTRKFTGVGTRDIENYNILDKETNQWVPRAEFLGIDKSRRIIDKMSEVFKQATRN